MKKKILGLSLLMMIILPTKAFAIHYGLSEFKSGDTELYQATIMGPNEEPYHVPYTVVQKLDETSNQPVEGMGVLNLKAVYGSSTGTQPFSMKIKGTEFDTTKNYTLSLTMSAQGNMTSTIVYSGTELNEGVTFSMTPTYQTRGKVTVTLKETNTEDLINYTRSVCETAANPSTCESEETESFNTIVIDFSNYESGQSGPTTPVNPSNPSNPEADPEELERMEAFIKTTLTNNTLVLDTVDPDITSVRPELADSLLTAAFIKKFESKYEVYVTPLDNAKATIQLSYRSYVNNTYTSYSETVNVKYATKDTSINEQLEDLKTKLTHPMGYYEESYDNNFIIDDLNSLNYYFNVQNTNNEMAAVYFMPSYSSDIHNLVGNIGFDFMFDPRAGDAPNITFERIIGPINILYNGVVVENINPIGFTLARILYVPSDTDKTTEGAFKEAAEKRIKEYFKDQEITITEMDDIDNIPPEEYSWGDTPVIDVTKTDGKLYGIQIGENRYPYFIVADSDKMSTPVLKSVDKDTNIKVETGSYDVPLDTRINVRKLDKNSDEFKELAKKFKILDDMAFDIDLLSSSLDMKIETLANGTFKVYIPVSEATTKKSLVAVYVKEDGTLEEHKITFEGNYAVFETDHFSTYSIVDKSNNPETGDKILKYGIILGVCSLGLAALAIYTKKNKNKKD